MRSHLRGDRRRGFCEQTRTNEEVLIALPFVRVCSTERWEIKDQTNTDLNVGRR